MLRGCVTGWMDGTWLPYADQWRERRRGRKIFTDKKKRRRLEILFPKDLSIEGE